MVGVANYVQWFQWLRWAVPINPIVRLGCAATLLQFSPRRGVLQVSKNVQPELN